MTHVGCLWPLRVQMVCYRLESDDGIGQLNQSLDRLLGHHADNLVCIRCCYVPERGLRALHDRRREQEGIRTSCLVYSSCTRLDEEPEEVKSCASERRKAGVCRRWVGVYRWR